MDCEEISAPPKLTEKCVIIQRDENGFGFRVKGQSPVFVEHVHKNSAAWRAGLRSFDQICKVNGIFVANRDHKDVVNLIKRSDRHVSLTLLGSVAGLSSPYYLKNKRHKSLISSSNGDQLSDVSQRKLSSASAVLDQAKQNCVSDSVRRYESFRTTSTSNSVPFGAPDSQWNTRFSQMSSSARRSESVSYKVAYRDDRRLSGIDVDQVASGKCKACSGSLINTLGPCCLECVENGSSRKILTIGVGGSCNETYNNKSGEGQQLQTDLKQLTTRNEGRPPNGSSTVRESRAAYAEARSMNDNELLRLHNKITQSASSSSLPARGSGSFEHKRNTVLVRPSNRRLEIIKELLDTELAHIERLRQLDDIFYRPMKAEKLVTPEQLKMVFSRHRALLKIHGQIHQVLLKSAQYNKLEEPLVGRALIEIFEGRIGRKFEHAASIFCACQSTNNDLLNKLTRRDTKVGEFLAQAARHVVGRLGLKDLLASCFQRLTKYPLLLENLLKATPTAMIDKANFGDESQCIARALNKSREILTRVNEAVKMANSETRLKEIWRKTDKQQFIIQNSLDISNQQLIHDGPLTLRLSKRSFDVHVVLMNDFLIILSRETQDKFKLRNFSMDGKSSSSMATLTSTGFSPIFEVDEHLTTRDAATDGNGFYLLRKHKEDSRMYELGAQSPADRSRWRERIQWAVENKATKCQLGVHSSARRHSYESSRSDTSSRQDLIEEQTRLSNSSSQSNIKRERMSLGETDKPPTDVLETMVGDENLLPSKFNKNNSNDINNSGKSAEDDKIAVPKVQADSFSKIEGSISYVSDEDVLIMPSKIEKSRATVREAVKMVSVEQKLKLIDRELQCLLEQKLALIGATMDGRIADGNCDILTENYRVNTNGQDTFMRLARARPNRTTGLKIRSAEVSPTKRSSKDLLHLAMGAAKVSSLLMDEDITTKWRDKSHSGQVRDAIIDLRTQIDSFLELYLN